MLLSEAMIFAAISLAIYLAVGAYTVGYQFQFGFTYISLGLEVLVDAARRFVIPLGIASIITFCLAFALHLLTARAIALRLAIMLWPLVACFVVVMTFMTPPDLAIIDPVTYYALTLYTVGACLALWPRSTAFLPQRTFDILLATTAAVLLILLLFDIGITDAIHQSQFLRCPDFDKRQWVVVQYTDTVFICAEADPAAGKIYANFRYLNVGDDGLTLDTINFSPSEIGVIKPMR